MRVQPLFKRISTWICIIVIIACPLLAVVGALWPISFVHGGLKLSLYSGRMLCEHLSGNDLLFRQVALEEKNGFSIFSGFGLRALLHYPFVSLGEFKVTKTALTIEFPLWIPVVLASSILIALRIRSARDNQRQSDRLACSQCGYNLTGNTSGICPECGTPTTSATV